MKPIPSQPASASDAPLIGYPANSPVEKHLRLYVDPQQSDYYDIPEEAIVRRDQLPLDPLGRWRVWVKPGLGLTRCGEQAAAVHQLAGIAATQNVGIFHYNRATSRSQIKSVGIVGGGTAGYITALTLRRMRPELDVTLIESTKIPPIGVGEATTSEILPYLHVLLGLDVVEFYAKVKPTWKLGIRFEWGQPGDYYFNEPFDFGRMLESHLYEKHIRNMSVMSVLMSDNKGPILQAGHDFYSLLGRFPYAYHLDNHRLLSYLREKLQAFGVRHLERHIQDVLVESDGENVAAIVDDGGNQHRFDLYIDCSGFRCLMLENKLGSKFVSYSDSLYTDRAIVGNVPHHGRIKPYTTAETMDNGWCWNIPTMEDDHRGYVFCSAYASDEEAEREMRRNNPQLGETRVIDFRSGRHEHFWKGNVVAMGNAYAFVEPLESTGIQALMAMNLMLHNHFPVYKNERRIREILNQQVSEYWDHLRWFLAVHYRFNHRKDTPFWQTCRRQADISGAANFLEMFREAAPLTYRNASVGAIASLPYLPLVYDVMLFGQGVEAQYVPPREDLATFRRRTQAYHGLSRRALPQEQALQVLTRHRPDLLNQQISDPRSWVHEVMRLWDVRAAV